MTRRSCEDGVKLTLTVNLPKIKSGLQLLSPSAFARTGSVADQRHPALALPQIFDRLGQFSHLHRFAAQVGSHYEFAD